MKRVIFIKQFANKIKGDVIDCESLHAHSLVNIDKVAEYTTNSLTKVNKDAVHVEVSELNSIKVKSEIVVVNKKQVKK